MLAEIMPDISDYTETKYDALNTIDILLHFNLIVVASPNYVPIYVG